MKHDTLYSNLLQKKNHRELVLPKNSEKLQGGGGDFNMGQSGYMKHEYVFLGPSKV